jgi:hypothetical protein
MWVFPAPVSVPVTKKLMRQWWIPGGGGSSRGTGLMHIFHRRAAKVAKETQRGSKAERNGF